MTARPGLRLGCARPGPTAVGAAAGLVVDRYLGEPPAALHPVVLLGRALVAAERRWWADSLAAGGRHLLLACGLAAGSGWAAKRIAARAVGGRRWLAAAMSTTVATALCTASRSLETEAVAVARALDDGDLAGARRRVRSLVGRDVDGLDADGVVRAVVESVAENTVDAVVAPLLWAAVGGAPAVAVHRAVNTLDAMVGYRTERYRRFGWASARLDDAANWLPARCTAAAVVLVRPGRTAAVVRAVRRDAPAHPSPNAGVAEAAFAGALGCRLGGPTCYGGRLEQRPALGDGPPPGRGDVDRAVALSRQVGAVVAGLTVAVGWLGRGPARRMRWRRRRWSR